MRLKKLEIVGFKSFLEKTTFHFDVPITSIVGPNGCGKSNIVDALKWVTGELSSKELRGKSMEDLIFAGSELRPPTSMMEVSLTLDNNVGMAPEQYRDFAEITILRRIFRDGSSEFYINKAECRLKDILDLFLDTGIGQSSYSIIEQGRIGAIVAGRPEDRRLIIEEAAGITKFKHRKLAAQRKMDATKQNLLRVTDIIQELKRQIGSLERQAAKAERFRVMRDQARELDLSLLSRELVIGKQAAASLESQEAEFSQSNDADEVRLLSMEGEYEQIRLALLEQEKVLEQSQQALFERKSKIQEIDNRIASEHREIEFLNKQIEQDRERAEFLGLQFEENQKKSNENQSLKDQLRVELEALEVQLHEGLSSFEKTSASLQEVERGLEAEKAVFLSVSTEEARAHNQVQSAEKRIQQLDEKLSQILQKLSEIDAGIQALTVAGEEKKRLLQEVTQLKFTFESNQESLRSEIEALGERKTAVTASLSETHQKLEGLRSRLGTLEEFIQGYQGYKKGARTVMENRQTIGGVLALLGEVIHPQRGYERAAQAALSDLVECVLVDQRKDALNIIQHLKDHQGGRGTFISKVATFSSRESDLSNMPGVLGWLTDYIRVDDDHDPFIRALLSSTLLVESLERAIELWESGFRFNMVTPAGDRITERGFISGGDWSEETGILEIHNQADEIKDDLVGVESQAKALEGELSLIAKDLVLKQTQLKEIQADLEREAKRSKDVEREYQRVEEDLKVARSKQEFLSQEKQTAEQEKEQLSSTVSEWVAKRDALATDKSASEEKQKAWLAQISQAKASVQSQNQVTTELKVRKASTLEKIEALERENKALATTMEESTSEKAALEQNCQDHAVQAESKKSQLGEWERAKLELIEAFHEAEKAFGQIRSEYDQKAQQSTAIESDLKRLRATREEWVEKVNQVRLQIQENKLKLDRLREQCYERYSVYLEAHMSESGFTLLEDERVAEVQAEWNDLREKMSKIGDVNLGAIGELEELKARFEFLSNQKIDLEKSLEDLSEAIKKISGTTKEMFVQTFEAINAKFEELFPHLFRGGKAKLVLTNPEDILESGIDIVAQPPGKKLQNMNLLSGGEKALTAISLLFAIFEHKAPPVCVLDEVDAPLDEVNVGRFLDMVKTMSQKTQFIVITHNKNTMEIADNLYGVTMEEPGVSRTVSVRVQKVVEHAATREPVEIQAAG